MAVTVRSFEKVKVLRVRVTDPMGLAATLFLVCGVAILNYQGQRDNYNRDTVTFLVPNEGQTSPSSPALDVGISLDSTAIAFPATFEAQPQRPVGWGIDSVETTVDGPDGHNIQLTAHLAALNPGATIIRMGFQVNNLSQGVV